MKRIRFTEEQIIGILKEAAGPGAVPAQRDHRDDVLSVAQQVRRYRRERGSRLEAAGGREPAAQADRSGSSAQPPGAEGHPGKRGKTAVERRRVVGQIQAAAGVSERRAIRFTGFPRDLVSDAEQRPTLSLPHDHGRVPPGVPGDPRGALDPGRPGQRGPRAAEGRAWPR